MSPHEETREGTSLPENALFVCFGGLSNTGYITALAAMEAVRTVGLKKAAIFCLAGLPAGLTSVKERAGAAQRIITVDGCANNCARKMVEAAGLHITRAITLEDLGVKKVPFFQGRELSDPDECISDDDVSRVRLAILRALETT